MKEHKSELYKKFRLKKINIPKNILSETEHYLKEHGDRGCEGMVLWSGVKHGNNEASIRSCLHPLQKCTAIDYWVPIEESQKVNIILEQKKEVIIAQVHSHPRTAFHSAIDDRFPATFIVGFFSIVVPEFCRGGLKRLSDCEILEHIGLGKWRKLTVNEVNERFFITT